MKLLILDDQGPVGAIISRIAQQSGWQAFHTVSPDQIQKTIQDEQIDVIMLDYLIESPESKINGLSILETLRSSGITIPAILFTGWPDLVDRSLAKTLNVLGILEKPLSIQELRITLNDAKKQVLEQAASS